MSSTLPWILFCIFGHLVQQCSSEIIQGHISGKVQSIKVIFHGRGSGSIYDNMRASDTATGVSIVTSDSKLNIRLCAFHCTIINSDTNSLNYDLQSQTCECVRVDWIDGRPTEQYLTAASGWKFYEIVRKLTTIQTNNLDTNCTYEPPAAGIGLVTDTCTRACSNGYSHLPGTGNCYKLHNTGAGSSHADASDICQQNGAKLAQITSLKQLEEIHNILPASGLSNQTVWRFDPNQVSYVIVPAFGTQSYDQLTVMVWVKFGAKPWSRADSIISYYEGGNGNELLLYHSTSYPSVFHLIIDGLESGTYSKPANLDMFNNEWHHLAFTWRSSDGQLRIYVDGEINLEQTLNVGHQIPSDGYMILGQDQDDLLSGFDAMDSFSGWMRDIQFGSSVLSSEQIIAVYNSPDEVIMCLDIIGCDLEQMNVVGSDIYLVDTTVDDSSYWVGGGSDDSGDRLVWLSTCDDVVDFTSPEAGLPSPPFSGGTDRLALNTSMRYNVRDGNDNLYFICQHDHGIC